MAARRPHQYPPLTTRLPAYLHARLQAAATVLSQPIDELVGAALEGYFESLDETQIELIDRFAAETLRRSETSPLQPPS